MTKSATARRFDVDEQSLMISDDQRLCSKQGFRSGVLGLGYSFSPAARESGCEIAMCFRKRREVAGLVGRWGLVCFA